MCTFLLKNKIVIGRYFRGILCDLVLKTLLCCGKMT